MACFQKEAKGLGKASKLISSESFWLRVRSEKKEADAGLGPVQMQKKSVLRKINQKSKVWGGQKMRKELVGRLKVASTTRKKLNVIKIVYTKLKDIGQKQNTHLHKTSHSFGTNG